MYTIPKSICPIQTFLPRNDCQPHKGILTCFSHISNTICSKQDSRSWHPQKLSISNNFLHSPLLSSQSTSNKSYNLQIFFFSLFAVSSVKKSYWIYILNGIELFLLFIHLGELEQIYVVNILFSIASIIIDGIGLNLVFSVLPLLHSILHVTVNPVSKTQTTIPTSYLHPFSSLLFSEIRFLRVFSEVYYRLELS